MANNTAVGELGMQTAALHALWTIAGLVDLDTNEEAYNVVKGGLFHPAEAVRKAAIEILPENQLTDNALLNARTLQDKSPKVRLAALIYFAKRPASDAVGEKLFELSGDQEIVNDSWLSKALYAAAASHADGFLTEYARANPDFNPESATSGKRQDPGFDDQDWKTMQLPQHIEEAGLEMDGIIWFRRNFNFNSSASSYISLGPIDDSDVVFINGEQIGATEADYERDRYYNIPKGLLKSNGNTIAIRVEDTGGNGGLYGRPEQMFIRSGDKTIRLSGLWKYEVEADYGQSANNTFGGIPIAEFIARNYSGNATLEDASGEKATNSKVIHIKTIQNEMKFDLTEFVVEAGQQVELVLENVDFMQHNLVIVKPGKKDIVGAEADKLAADPKGAELQYVPQTADVLFATALADPEQSVILRFTAPSEAGEYPFICTFPGHWRIMQGVMKVVAN